MRGDLPTGTVTFLFTDIEGSTRLIDELGEGGYLEALAEHRRLLRETFGAHGGVEVDTQGDAFLYAFVDAGAALTAATEGQETLATGPVKVRMGLHTGEPLQSAEGYAGRELHRAARIAAAGHGGQLVISAATATLVDGDLIELGEHRLKDFDEPVALFQLGTREFPPLKTIANTNLPRPASSFVGREQERNELLALLRAGTRLLTLSGPGGSGKTRLAVETAIELIPEFRGGVFWVGLSVLRDPALVTESIAQTLGAKDGLAEHIGEREQLLLLDNFEQVVEAAPDLATLLEACPNLRLLITSRELLRVRGEVEYEVFPLAESDAVELFCVRAGVAPDSAVEELCRRLDNLPLALELAAARAKLLTPNALLERLSQRLDLLRGGRDADPRQRTLRATVRWSYELLSEHERAAFVGLSIFTGSFSLESADAVAGADLDVMSSLVDKSLVRRTQEGRFFLLETIRQLGIEELAQQGRIDDVCEEHARYYLELARRSAWAPYTSFDETWVRRFPLEEPQLRTALATFANGRASQLAEMCVLLWYTWDYFGRLAEGRAHIENALQGAADNGLQRALLEEALSCIAWRQGDGPVAAGAAERAVSILRELGDLPRLANALRALSNAYRMVGDSVSDDRTLAESAQRALAESAELARAVGDVTAEVAALVNGNSIALERRDYEAALSLSTAAVELATSHALPEIASAAHHGSGSAHFYLGNVEAAAASFKASLLAYGAGASRALYDVAYIVDALAAVAARGGDFQRAARLLGAVRRIVDETGITFDRTQGEMHRGAVAATLATLGPDRYSEVSAAGAELSLDDLIDEALNESPSVDGVGQQPSQRKPDRETPRVPAQADS